MNQNEITNDEWQRIKAYLPPQRTGQRGRPSKDNRAMLNGILWVLKSVAQWRLVPECYGKYNTVYDRFARWRDKGILENIFQALSQDADKETISIDSTSIKVHQSANGGQKKEDKAVGRSRGGLNTKIHTLVDALGNPLRFLLSPGNDHDAVHAERLIEGMDLSGSTMLGDKAYGAQRFRECLALMGAAYAIPPKSNALEPWPVDYHLYKERHLVECFFQKLKWCRRIFTRYDKVDKSFLAFVYLGAILLLLK